MKSMANKSAYWFGTDKNIQIADQECSGCQQVAKLRPYTRNMILDATASMDNFVRRCWKNRIFLEAKQED